MKTINVIDCGASPLGDRVCTQELQRAIDLCEAGGTVYIPKGTFLTGAIFLKSNMTLYLEDGARLCASKEVCDFPVMGYPYEGFDQLCYASLINTDSAPHENITIEGKGTIDAGGRALFDTELSGPYKRGRAVCIRGTRHLTIKGVTIRQSPAWCLHIIYCEDVLLEGIEVHSKYDEQGKPYEMFNCDGIDIDSCRSVKIKDCIVASQDDCIALKSGRNEAGRRAGIPTEDVLIENCTFKSGFGVAVGSEMSGGVKDVYVRNCSFTDTFSIASIKAIRGRGAYIKNIHYENCTLVNRDEKIKETKWFRGGIYIDGFYGEEGVDKDLPVEVNDGTPTVEDIYFKNITVDTIEGHSIYMCGLPESHFKNIVLENVKAKGSKEAYIRNIDGLISR